MMKLFKGRSKWHPVRICLTAIGFLCINSLVAFSFSQSAQAQGEDGEEKVQTVRTRGIVESESAVELRAITASTITFLVPSGSTVKEGDVVVRLNTSDVQNAFDAQRIKLQKAKANSVSARARVESLTIEQQASTRFAEQAKEVAKLRLETFLGKNGESATELALLQDKLEAAVKTKEAFSSAMKRVGESTDMLPPLELANIQSHMAQAEAEVSMIKRRMRLHETTTKLRAAELRLAQSEQSALFSTRASILRNSFNQAQAEQAAAETAVKIEKDNVKMLERKLKNCTMLAPRDGVILRASAPNGRRGAVEIKEGTRVLENHLIARVIDMKRLQVPVLVDETQIGHVRVGQRATVRVDAFVEKEFEGKVAKVSDTPEPLDPPNPIFDGNAKKYRVIVSIDATPQLRTGMSALVEIE